MRDLQGCGFPATIIPMTHYVSRAVSMALLAFCISGMWAAAQQHVFTNKEGAQIVAEIVSVDPDWRMMSIRKDGTVYEIPPNKLILDDQQFVKTWLKERGIYEPRSAAATTSTASAGSPVTTVSTPTPEPASTPTPALDLSGIRLDVKLSKKLVDTEKRDYSSYTELVTKKYSFSVSLTNLGRQTIPAPKISYAAVWKERVRFSSGSYYTTSSTGNYAIKGQETLPDLVYNRPESIATGEVSVDQVMHDGNRVYREDELLGVVVKLELADGTEIAQHRSTLAEAADLDWAAVANLPSKPSSSFSTVDDDDDSGRMVDGRLSLKLKQGQGREGPMRLQGKRLTFSATVSPDTKSPDGVIMAVGGPQNGFAVYVKDRKVQAGVRVGGSYEVVSQPLPFGEFELKASMSAAELSISVDGRSPATSGGLGLFKESIQEGIDIGQDSGEPAGDYTGSFRFAGDIEGAVFLARD